MKRKKKKKEDVQFVKSTFYKDAPFTKLQEKTCGLSALP